MSLWMLKNQSMKEVLPLMQCYICQCDIRKNIFEMFSYFCLIYFQLCKRQMKTDERLMKIQVCKPWIYFDWR